MYELIEEVVERAAAMVLEHHIAAEIYPYSVQSVKASILKIIAVSAQLQRAGTTTNKTKNLVVYQKSNWYQNVDPAQQEYFLGESRVEKPQEGHAMNARLKGARGTQPLHACRWIFTLFHSGMHFYDKLAHAKNSVYQALIWLRPG